MIGSSTSATPVRSTLAVLGRDALAVLVMLMIASIGGVPLVAHRRATQPLHPTITLSELREHVAAGDALLLDARDRTAYAAGHIPTALSLPMKEWHARSAELGGTLRRFRDRLVIVYCSDRWCGQSEQLQLALIAIGHKRVGHFEAGFNVWREAGLPVTRSP